MGTSNEEGRRCNLLSGFKNGETRPETRGQWLPYQAPMYSLDRAGQGRAGQGRAESHGMAWHGISWHDAQEDFGIQSRAILLLRFCASKVSRWKESFLWAPVEEEYEANGRTRRRDGWDDVGRNKDEFAKKRGGVRDGACGDWSAVSKGASRRILAISCGSNWWHTNTLSGCDRRRALTT
nr:hypothetical protein B24B19.290 [imported] - Neurospora crassa [Neurospora crassa]